MELHAQFAQIYELSQDQGFLNRLRVACVVEEIENPDIWVSQWALWCARFGNVAVRYAEDKENPFHVRHGENPDVISDEKITEILTYWKKTHGGVSEAMPVEPSFEASPGPDMPPGLDPFS